MIWSWMPVRLTWAGHDRHARLSRLAIAGLAAGAALAVFGLPPADIHGPLHYLGIMDPLCGVTRGVRLALLGHFGRAWQYNPLSVALVGGAIAAVLRQVFGVATGRWPNLYVVRRRPVLVIAVLLTVALEICQQAHAALLRTTGARFPFAGVMLIMAAGAVIAVGIVAIARRRRRSGRKAAGRAMAGCAGQSGSR